MDKKTHLFNSVAIGAMQIRSKLINLTQILEVNVTEINKFASVQFVHVQMPYRFAHHVEVKCFTAIANAGKHCTNPLHYGFKTLSTMQNCKFPYSLSTFPGTQTNC